MRQKRMAVWVGVYTTTNFVTKPLRVEHCRGPILICSYGCAFSPQVLFSYARIIPFSLMDPQTKLGQRGTQSATAITGVDPAHYDPIVPTLTDVTELAVGGHIQGTHVHNPVRKTIATMPTKTPLHRRWRLNPTEASRSPIENRTVNLISNIDNSSNSIPLDSTIVTPIHVDALDDALRGHPDPSFVLKLCSDLRFGARLGYDGPRMSKFSKNLKSAIDNPTIVSNNLAKEVALGRTAGPFTNPPFANLQVSPIGIVPKKHSDKFRTIFHLSFPKTGESINSFIEKDDFSLQYIKIDDAIAALIQLGRGTYLAKTDVESAFRQFPVHPDDWELLGMYWNNSYYFDKVLPFGLRSAPYIFNQLSDALEWILLNKCFISYVGHILDDFLIMEPPAPTGLPSQACQSSLSSMLLTFNTLGVPIAEHKTEGPSLIIEFLGIILDSQRMEARLPSDKLSRLSVDLDSWHTKKSATLQELQSLIGTLNFACRVIPPGRAFLQRIITLTRGVSKPHHHIRLTNGFREDIKMWQIFLKDWNGTSLFLNPSWENSAELSLYTDASGTLGFGGIFRTQWFQGKWLPHQTLATTNISIDWQELYAIVVASYIWASIWAQKRIMFYCDNQAVVYIINSKRSKSPRIMDLVRALTLQTMKYNFYFKAVHVPGHSNDIADSISRFQQTRFRRLAPHADQQPQPLPEELSRL